MSTRPPGKRDGGKRFQCHSVSSFYADDLGTVQNCAPGTVCRETDGGSPCKVPDAGGEAALTVSEGYMTTQQGKTTGTATAPPAGTAGPSVAPSLHDPFPLPKDDGAPYGETSTGTASTQPGETTPPISGDTAVDYDNDNHLEEEEDDELCRDDEEEEPGDSADSESIPPDNADPHTEASPQIISPASPPDDLPEEDDEVCDDEEEEDEATGGISPVTEVPQVAPPKNSDPTPQDPSPAVPAENQTEPPQAAPTDIIPPLDEEIECENRNDHTPATQTAESPAGPSDTSATPPAPLQTPDTVIRSSAIPCGSSGTAAALPVQAEAPAAQPTVSDAAEAPQSESADEPCLDHPFPLDEANQETGAA